MEDEKKEKPKKPRVLTQKEFEVIQREVFKEARRQKKGMCKTRLFREPEDKVIKDRSPPPVEPNPYW